MICWYKQGAHLLEIIQNADTLLVQTRPVPTPAVTQNRKSCFDKGQQTSQVVPTVVEIQGKVPRSNYNYNQKQRDRSPPKNWDFNNDVKNQQVMHCGVCGSRSRGEFVLVYSLLEKVREFKRNKLPQDDEFG